MTLDAVDGLLNKQSGGAIVSMVLYIKKMKKDFLTAGRQSVHRRSLNGGFIQTFLPRDRRVKANTTLYRAAATAKRLVGLLTCMMTAGINGPAMLPRP